MYEWPAKYGFLDLDIKPDTLLTRFMNYSWRLASFPPSFLSLLVTVIGFTVDGAPSSPTTVESDIFSLSTLTNHPGSDCSRCRISYTLSIPRCDPPICHLRQSHNKLKGNLSSTKILSIQRLTRRCNHHLTTRTRVFRRLATMAATTITSRIVRKTRVPRLPIQMIQMT